MAAWWERLVRPHHSIEGEQVALRVRLYLTIQLLFILMSSISLPLMILYEALPHELGLCLIVWFMSVSYYVFGRTRWYRQTILVSSVLLYIWFLIVIQMFPLATLAILYMALPLVFISLFHGVGMTLLVSAVTAPLVFAISLLTPTEYTLTNVLSAIILFCVGGGISLGTHMREQFTQHLAQRTRQVEEREARFRQLFEITPLSLLVMDFGDLVARLNTLRTEHRAGLRAYLEAHPAEVIALFRRLRVLAVNEATRKLFETPVVRLLDENSLSRLGNIQENRDALLEAVVAFATGSAQVEFELTLTTGSARRFDAVVRWTPAPGYDPSALVMIVSVEDITARKEAEQQRIELAVGQERVSIIQGFVGDMSHDLLTPLSVIRTSAYLAKRGQIDASARERLATIDTQVEHVQLMVRDMLMLTRLEEPTEHAFTFTTGDLEPLLAQIVTDLRALATHNEQSLHYVASEGGLIAHHDGERMRRAVTNIINNALKYTPSGGSIWVRSCVRDREILVEVQDTGPGIAADEVSYVFNRFYRAKEHRKSSGGLGLGLAIAQKIVRGHQGSIEVESVVGSGTTFRIRLPMIAHHEAIPAISAS